MVLSERVKSSIVNYKKRGVCWGSYVPLLFLSLEVSVLYFIYLYLHFFRVLVLAFATCAMAAGVGALKRLS